MVAAPVLVVLWDWKNGDGLETVCEASIEVTAAGIVQIIIRCWGKEGLLRSDQSRGRWISWAPQQGGFVFAVLLFKPAKHL